jgi:hypothetical protein
MLYLEECEGKMDAFERGISYDPLNRAVAK